VKRFIGKRKVPQKLSAISAGGEAVKKPPKARSCPHCGNPLEGLMLWEALPVAAFFFQDGRYHDTDLAEPHENATFFEVRCCRCDTRLDGVDLDFIKKRAAPGVQIVPPSED
jgi:hypothetical protein